MRVPLPGVEVGILMLIDRNRVAEKLLHFGTDAAAELGHIDFAAIATRGKGLVGHFHYRHGGLQCCWYGRAAL